MSTTPAAASEQTCVCGHWPLNGAAQIQKAAHTLRELSKCWDAARQLLEEDQSGRCVCLDLTVVPLDDVQLDVLLLQAAQVPDAVYSVVRSLSGQARDFASVKDWLTRSAQAASQNQPGPRVVAYERQAPVHDYHRVIARDWLAADMNASIAWLLGRAGRVLVSLDMSPDAVSADLLGAGRYQSALLAAAVIAERAAVLARESAAYVEDFNHRWLTLHTHITGAAALYPLNTEPLRAGTAPLPLLPRVADAAATKETLAPWQVFTTWAVGAPMPLAA